MQISHPQRSIIFAVLCCAALAISGLAQDAIVRASFANPPKEPIAVYVLTGQSLVVRFDQNIGRLAVSNLDFAEAVLVAPDQMVINGKASGRARFTTWSRDEQMIFFDVDVRVNLAQIDSQVRALFPKIDIRLSQANGSVVLSGSAEPKIAQQIEQVVQSAGFKTVNLLAQPVQDSAQVQLLVRVAEVSRNKLAEYSFSPAYQSSPGTGGYSNTGTGPYNLSQVDQGNIIGSVASTLNLFVMGGNAFAFLRALQQNGALRALAEPNLIAMNGQTASFLAGGEIPVPIVQGGGGNGGNSVSIQWKEYGVRLNFKPTILDEQHIRLELEPEVSTLDYSNAARLSGFLIPALRVRRAKTGIELQDGQSFGIAGLLDNNEIKSAGKMPIIGDIPILGNLFKSKSFQSNETELVFIVTVKLTKPLNPDAVPRFREVDDLRKGSPLGVEDPKADGAASSQLVKPAAEAAPVVPATVGVDESKQKASVTAEPIAEPSKESVEPTAAKPITESNDGADGKGAAADSSAKKGNRAGLARATPQLFALEKMQWTLSPPTDFKDTLTRALAAQLNFTLPAVSTKPEQ